MDCSLVTVNCNLRATNSTLGAIITSRPPIAPPIKSVAPSIKAADMPAIIARCNRDLELLILHRFSKLLFKRIEGLVELCNAIIPTIGEDNICVSLDHVVRQLADVVFMNVFLL